MSHNDKYAQVHDLCIRIGLHEDVIRLVLNYIDNGEYLIAESHFNGLLSRESSKKSAEAITNLWKNANGTLKDSGFGIMAAFMAAALLTREKYSEKGIEVDIFYHTMSCFREAMDESYAIDGAWSFDGADWCRHHIAGNLYRLGTLEFEMAYLDQKSAGACGLKEGEPVLSVHIQTGSDISRHAVDGSYRLAREFFPKYFPDFICKWFYCSTWLLDPVLKKLLPEGSRILDFQSDYDVAFIINEGDWYFPRIFNIKNKPADCENLPENTSLRRAAKHHILQGGTIGWALGLMNI